MRVAMFVLAAMVAAGPATAEPDERDSHQPAPPTKLSVVLASADQPRSPAPDTVRSPPAPSKRRIARVTTCRCGDPQAAPDTPGQ